MKSLPIGVSTFQSIINSNALYVDKTEVLYNLIYDKVPKRYFFSRPRRFGKSLTCSTLNAIFEGRKELFKDLWIGHSDYEFQERPVLYFDFSGISHRSPEALEQGLHSTLETHARKYSIVLEKKRLPEKFAELITSLGTSKGSLEKFYQQIFFMVACSLDNALPLKLPPKKALWIFSWKGQQTHSSSNLKEIVLQKSPCNKLKKNGIGNHTKF